MKTLVNGGLNLSELEGWWAEAYRADVGWAIGDGREHDNDLSIGFHKNISVCSIKNQAASSTASIISST
jgi:glucan phosphorylase